MKKQDYLMTKYRQGSGRCCLICLTGPIQIAIKSYNPTSAQDNSGPQDQSLTCAF